METVRRRSKVWLNFTKINDKSARCNICKTIISCKGGCTTNMIKHLRGHGVQITECPVFDALRRPSSVATSSTASTSAASTSGSDPHPSTALSAIRLEIATVSQAVTPFTLTSKGKMSVQQVQECHRKVTAFIVKRLHPFSDVESPTFRDMVKAINPKYTPPTRDYLANKLIPSWLARLTEEDFRKAEDFIKLMKLFYTSTLCVSSEKSPTCGQILPILQKLKAHLTVKEGDTVFVKDLKKQVWGNLSKRYQNDETRNFLQVATALDPRFKHKLEDDTVWDQIQRKLIKQVKCHSCIKI
ncbi:uncharacterized protein LOC129108719 [Anoplopoma fimbria]|uniref:uncharacterized protein LOC129108719 n=1 Tax=Anoplopoma fimbria TaxID=229290 RepID=UPI0023ECB152|nr:uncharacterized protein LOC129108719 [Anoplopoma fimbria]